ncbi:MAG TPA: efflux transporter outer membrane subunit [Zeimonas sp.]
MSPVLHPHACRGVGSRRRAGIAVVSLVLAATGCTMLGPEYRRPPIALPAQYDEAVAQPGAAPTIPPNWWSSYRDPDLDRLVARALAHNVDARAAVARLEEAQAALREARAVLVPQVDLSAAATRSRISSSTAQPVPPGVDRTRSDHRVSLGTAFELDFWGRLRRGAQAVEAQWLASRFALDVVGLDLAATTAHTWFALRSLDAQVAVTRDSLRAREESLEVVRARAEGGLVSDLDLHQARAARADTAVQLAELQRQRDEVEHQLAALTGEPGMRVAPGDLRAMPVPPSPPPGVPSSLLVRRPDIRQAEAQLAAANALIGVARAAMMPTISLTGAFGGQSGDLADLLRAPARFWSLGIGLALPIFDAGRLQARTDQAEARERQALAAYQRTVETAYREVADALTNGSHAASAEREVDLQVEAARASVQLAQSRYQAGYSGYLEVLDALRVQHAAELALIRNRQSRLSFSVDLMQALGGGWIDPTTALADQPLRSASATPSVRGPLPVPGTPPR